MKMLRFLLGTIALTVAVVSCNKEPKLRESISFSKMSQKDAMEAFAQILSKATASEPELVSFIRNEALKQFDKDFDVFYPWVKDVSVSKGRTFRQILKQYDRDERLEKIEAAMPLLNILVPEWSWIDARCFSVKNWDGTGVPFVCFQSGNSYPAYLDGKKELIFEWNNFPANPVFFVKNSERMKLDSPASKGGAPTYSFIDEEYDSAPTRDIILEENEIVFSTQTPVDAVSGNILSGKLEYVYGATTNNSGITQRDYLYYDMTSSCDSGYVDSNYQEAIYYIRCNDIASRFIHDETGYDFNTVYNSETSSNQITPVALKNKIWCDGNLDLFFYIYMGNESVTKVRSVTFKSLYDVKKVYETKYYSNGESYYVYTVTDDSFTAKWCRLNQKLFTWDIRRYPSTYKVSIKEFDESTTTQETESLTFTYMTNYSVGIEQGVNEGVTFKTGFNEGVSSTFTQSYNYQRTTTNDSDDCGSFVVAYHEPVITGPVVYSGSLGTPVKAYDTGLFDIFIMPNDYSY